MAIRMLFNLFVVRKESIKAKYPGGLEQFRTDWMAGSSGRKSRGEDGHLIAIASMGWYFEDVVEKLLACGLQNRHGGKVIDIAFGSDLLGVEDGCDWLSVLDGGIGIKVCWLAGTDPGKAVDPLVY